MGLIKFLFGNKKDKKDENANHSCFSVEFYPITKRYYPKYKRYYMATRYSTGIVELKEPFLFSYADYGNTEEEADEIIKKFKEQQLKENVVTILK